MSEFNPTERPHWATDTETPSGGWSNSVIHRSAVETWGSSSVWLERFDVDGSAGIVEVCIETPTVDVPRGERFVLPLASASEVLVVLDRLLGKLTGADALNEWRRNGITGDMTFGEAAAGR